MMKIREMAASTDSFMQTVKKQKVEGGKSAASAAYDCSQPYMETLAQTLWEKQQDVRANYDDNLIGMLEIEVLWVDLLASRPLRVFIVTCGVCAWYYCPLLSLSGQNRNDSSG